VKVGQRSYRRDIDGLRAIAVVAVIVNHVNKGWLPFGYLGVDMFFVISGFVITNSLAAHRYENLPVFLQSFYARRIRRLLPALVVCVVLCSFAVCLLDPEPRNSLLTGFFSLFGLSNLYLLHQSTDYFAASTELNAYTHTWSLGVEEQFYLIFPVIIYFTGVVRHRAAALRRHAWIMGILALASWLGFLFFNTNNQPLAYFSMPTRFWELAAGSLCFIALQAKPAVAFTQKFASAGCLAGLAAVLWLPSHVGDQVGRTTLAVILTSLLIITVRSDSSAYRFLTQRILVFLGLISYSLYLWHWPVLALSRLSIGVQDFSLPFQLLLILGLAWISYAYIETPFRFGKAGISAHGVALILVSVIAAATGMAALSYRFSGNFYLGRLLNVDYPSWIRRPWFTQKGSGGMDPCTSGTAITDSIVQQCLTASSQATTIAYVIGDSHARNYVPTVKALFGSNAVRYLTVGNECAYVPKPMQRYYRGDPKDCLHYVEFVTNYLIAHAKKADIVFVGQRLVVESDKQRQTAAYFDFIHALSANLRAKAVPIVLLDGTFPPAKPPKECYPMPWKPFVSNSYGCFVKRTTLLSAFPGFEALARDGIGKDPNFFYVPLRAGLCKGEICGQFTASGTPIWRDYGHITDAAASELWVSLATQLQGQGLTRRFPEVRFANNVRHDFRAKPSAANKL
jgi:hypothetical protein